MGVGVYKILHQQFGTILSQFQNKDHRISRETTERWPQISTFNKALAKKHKDVKIF